MDWNVVFAQVFGDAGAVGSGYEDNLRKGRVAPHRASQLFAWLAAHDPKRAAALIWTLEGETPAAWDALIVDHAKVEGLDLVRLPDRPHSVVGFADLAPLNAPRLRLGELFCFAVDAPFEGVALALQAQRQQWHLLPLSRSEAVTLVQRGVQHLPCDSAVGAPIPLAELSATGLCRFAFVLAETAQGAVLNLTTQPGASIAPRTLNSLARSLTALPREAWRLLLLDVQFTH